MLPSNPEAASRPRGTAAAVAAAACALIASIAAMQYADRTRHALVLRSLRQPVAAEPVAPPVTATMPAAIATTAASTAATAPPQPVAEDEYEWVAEAPPTAPPAPSPAATVAPPQPVRKLSCADQLYAIANQHLATRQFVAAQAALHDVLAEDPNYTLAHFRLGELALIWRDEEGTRRELTAALARAGDLTPRERLLSELGLAIVRGDLACASDAARQIDAINPRDGDLTVIRRVFGEHFDRPRRDPNDGEIWYK
ncbi:MAG TPA: hypothetical protein VF824_01410 [Thermoanaerobaculia bacterium]